MENSTEEICEALRDPSFHLSMEEREEIAKLLENIDRRLDELCGKTK